MATTTEIRGVVRAGATEVHYERTAPPGDGVPGRINLRAGKQNCSYFLFAQRTREGTRWRYDKCCSGSGTDEETEAYDVELLPGRRVEHADCWGYLRHGHCRHVEVARQLDPEDWPAPVADPPAPEPPPTDDRREEPLPAEGDYPGWEDPWQDTGEPVGAGDCRECAGRGVLDGKDCGTCQGWGSRSAAEWWAGRQPQPVSYLPDEETGYTP